MWMCTPRGPSRGQVRAKWVEPSSGHNGHCLGLGPPASARCGGGERPSSSSHTCVLAALRGPDPHPAHREHFPCPRPQPAEGTGQAEQQESCIHARVQSKTPPAQPVRPHCSAHAQLLPSDPSPCPGEDGEGGAPPPCDPSCSGLTLIRARGAGMSQLATSTSGTMCGRTLAGRGSRVAAEPRGQPCPSLP